MTTKQKQTNKDKKKICVCPACGLRYPNESLAKSCEDWCREHQSCNLEIIKHALPDEEKESAPNKS